MKYISVKDISDYYAGRLNATHSEFLDRAEDTVKVSDIKTLKEDMAINYQSNSKMVTYQYMQKRLTDLITP